MSILKIHLSELGVVTILIFFPVLIVANLDPSVFSRDSLKALPDLSCHDKRRWDRGWIVA